MDRSNDRIRYVYRRRRWIHIFRAIDGVGYRWRRPREGTPDFSSARNILVLKLDQIGDLILTQPLLASLRRAAPPARIAMLVARDRRPVVERFPEVDAVRELPMRIDTRGRTTQLSLGEWLRAIRSERRIAPDIIVVPREDPFSVLTATLIGSPMRVGFREGGLGFLLTHWVGVEEGVPQWKVLAHLAGPQGESAPPPVFPLQDEHREETDRWLATMQLPEKLPLIVVHPGAGAASKRWPWSRFAESIELIGRSCPASFLIVRGPGDGIPLDPVPRVEPPGIVLYSNHVLELGAFAALLARANLLIGNDSAPSHLAAAIGTAAIVLYLSPADPRRWAPTGHCVRVLRGELDSLPAPGEVAASALEILGLQGSAGSRGVARRTAGLAGSEEGKLR